MFDVNRPRCQAGIREERIVPCSATSPTEVTSAGLQDEELTVGDGHAVEAVAEAIDVAVAANVDVLLIVLQPDVVVLDRYRRDGR